jgi:CRISPR-associated protein Cas1
MPGSPDEWLVPVRGLNEFVYCPRLFHLVYVQGLFADNLETLEGRVLHRRKLASGRAVGTEEGDDEAPVPWSETTIKHLLLSDPELMITGKFDVVTESGDEVVPVEVKRGPAPEGRWEFRVGDYLLDAAAWDCDQIQLAAQMRLLRTAGYDCCRGKLYYRATRTLVTLEWSNQLAAALGFIARQARLLGGAEMPPPLVDSRKCIRCSLNHICLPDETLCLQRKCDEPRQLYPARDDAGVLHVTVPGARIGKTGETLKISFPGERRDEIVQLREVAHVCLWGNVQITTQALLEIAARGATVAYLTGGGWLRALTTPPLVRNVELRRLQYRHCDSSASALQVSRWIVMAKISNQRTLLRRNGADSGVLRELSELREGCGRAESGESLRGYEGRAGRVYWAHFPGLLKTGSERVFSMRGRNRRPPRDPVNALLSFGYSLLLRDCLVALHGVGMDPYYGLFHQLVPGRPALALDIMEPFRPLIVDSTVLRSINEGSFTEKSFDFAAGACFLKPAARRKWIAAYERRLDEMITHPLFGYRLSYRRLLAMEARLLGRYFTGELAEYRPLTTR